MFSDTFKALADPVRLEILNMLKKNGRMNAGEIADNFDLSKATISHHLKILREQDLIYETKEKNFIYYELNTSVFEDIMTWIVKFRGEDNEK
ncbi:MULTISPECIES: autorepressor SdpR family transcription factor [Peptoniphilus]|jgi:arsenical resistance operon repressor|uniref:autorepressor SdpR family transcription factor n=1 Tax=Peptoniphilus TaxID=162289 RepID=UPI000288F4DF|nr:MULTISPECIES: autorepressor SdpR family transcription factor [Peptoniphilus]MBS6610467.1 winged helix-turn-helix transcriptional regulator [Peptoniphilus harei]MDU1043056.1 autorepressor SdpR family transcription factor [Peptoniphilus rhinitidis]MDU3750496.1 autorepressor SdpR family transcription factor [Peptoniphilus rhinitidis]MDU5595133.1 autorepressor SdpR family transcription factor [Peptoniphilus rhinitidis]MDU7302093.1 autorepressor SdpR family transcription factor [Peptoniphilus la